MRYKHRLILSTIISIIIIGFSACGDDAHFKKGNGSSAVSNSERRIKIIDCNDSRNIEDYETMLSGDILIQAELDTSIETYHDINNNKKVCTKTGIAYLIRK